MKLPWPITCLKTAKKTKAAGGAADAAVDPADGDGDGADAADAGHGGAGVQGAARQAGVVEEALGAQRALHRPAEGILAHWVLHSGEILHAFIQGELTGLYRKG